MRKVALLLACALAVAVPASAKNLDYLVLKVGEYMPQSNDVKDLGFGNSLYGELGIGTHFSDNFAVEFDVGYTESTVTLKSVVGGVAGSADLKLTVVPVTLGVKALTTWGGWFQPYAILGAGAYYAKLDGSAAVGVSSGSGSVDDIALGGYIGVGFNVNLGQSFYLGAEGKYMYSQPTFNNQTFDISGGLVTGNLGYRF